MSTQAHTTVECVDCSDDITPGDDRYPTEDGPIHGYCRTRRAVTERYTLYVLNPPHTDGTEYSLWYDHGEFETPMMYEGGAGFTLTSISTSLGNGIPVTTAFANAIGYSYHSCISFVGYDHKLVEKEIEWCYDGTCPDQDRWAIHHLIYLMLSMDPLPPEFRELVEYADACTEFGTPDVEPSPLE